MIFRRILSRRFVSKRRILYQTIVRTGVNVCYTCVRSANIELQPNRKLLNNYKVSHVMRKPAFCICENKGADQLNSKHAADQRLCVCYIDSKIPLLPKSEISGL